MNPTIYGLGLEEGQEPMQRVAGLGSGWYLVDDRLYVVGCGWDGWGDGANARVFGVSEVREKTEA